MNSYSEDTLPTRDDIPEKFDVISMLNIPGIAHFNTSFGRLFFSTAMHAAGDGSGIKPGVCFMTCPGNGILELQVVKEYKNDVIEFEDGVIEPLSVWIQRGVITGVKVDQLDLI